jgi:hypothetical protein
MLDLSKLAQRNVYAHEYFVVVGDVSENTRIVERGRVEGNASDWVLACSGIEEMRFYSMTTTITEESGTSLRI